MHILMSGSSGFIGSALADRLRMGGHTVVPIVRSSGHPGAVSWTPSEGRLDFSALNGFDVLIHLSGENLAGKRWTATQKQKIRDSRIKSTSLLATALTSIENPPTTWVCASAIGYYGDRGSEWLDEGSVPGGGFLAGVCRAWEDATGPAAKSGVRVVNLRLGIVLDPVGGAFSLMLKAFRMGIAGIIGSGKQYMSWITREDAIRTIMYSLDNGSINGPLNTVAPTPITNRNMTKTLGRILRRPTVVPVPAFAARVLLGEMADATLLASARVRPKQLLDFGFAFDTPEFEGAVRAMLGNT